MNPLGELRLACFLEVYHDELLVDPDETDIDALRSALSKEIKDRKIIHPPMFERSLYDRAFEVFDHGTLDILSTEDTFKLLSGAENGVFQCQDTVTGEFGALKSAEFRLIPPTDRVPLYHCHRPACRAVHKTWLTTSHNTILDAREKLDKRLSRTTAASDWQGFFSDHSAKLVGAYDDMRSSGIVGLIGQCLTFSELHSVVKLGFAGRHSQLRDLCSKNGLAVRNPDDFLKEVGRSGMMQLLLLLTDRSLTELLDRAATSGLIDIPEREIRRPKLIDFASGYFDVSCRLSRHGVQYYSKDGSVAVQRLKRLVRSVYDLSDPNDERDLSWLLRAPEGETEEALETYLNRERPRAILQRLIFVGHRQYLKAAEACGITREVSDRTDDETLIEVMLWKLGYDLDSIESASKDLRDLTASMAEEVESHERFGVTEMRAIRSHSSPLFVALEDALDKALAYTAWATTFDHTSAQTPFTFDLKLARSHMTSILNTYGAGEKNSIQFHADGRNTLFPLISGFGVLASLLEQYAKDPSNNKLRDADLPTYHKLSTLRQTGFLYSVPFLNLSDESRNSIIRSLKAVVQILNEGGVLDVRNRLEHNREDFPTPEEFDSCLRAVRAFCDLAERRGLIPKQYRLIETRVDSAWRVRFVLEDSQGRTLEVNSSEGYGLPGLPSMGPVQLIMSSARIKGTGDYLRFKFGSRSPYVEMWENWPRYRAGIRSVEAMEGAD
ncbi:hypothetical protein [Streptomyces sp. NPDC047981]|uniref:hypothetical protein n=1 Tax=Streptomyces sp. NPDC047981 TaxID=3154610 RepID=UPI00341D621A